MQDVASDDVAAELALTDAEIVVLTVLRYRMMQRDIAAAKSSKQRDKKRGRRAQFRTGALTALSSFASKTGGESGQLHVSDFTGERWVERFSQALVSQEGAERYALLDDAPTLVAGNIQQRSRALLLLIDLYGFEPWDGEPWVERTRINSLREAVHLLTPLREEDLDSVTNEYRAVLRQLRRKNIPWGKLLVVSAAGLGVGVFTAGLAAPLIGGVVGSAVLGYSGAVATTAGLAALGGGSLAAGGFGMAGGTALIAGIGGVAGAGAAAGGARLTGWTAGQVVAEAIKLEVVTRLVLLDAQGDDEKARKVVEGLHLRINQVQERLLQLAEQVTTLREELATAKAALKKKDDALESTRARVQQLEKELAQVKSEHQQVTLSHSALEVVMERLDQAA